MVSPTDAVVREARAAGLSRSGGVSLADVERRRSQLWAVALLAMVALAAAIAVRPESTGASFQRLPAFRAGVVIFMLAVGAYLVEKEMHLRRLTRMFVAEWELNQSLVKELAHDRLTGLLSRAAFVGHLESAVAAARDRHTSLAVLFLDLDRFKAVNDTLGHQAGDAVLIDVARRLRHAVRESDALARFAGDEFTVLLEGIEGAADALRVADRIQTTFLGPFRVGDTDVDLGVSVGITVSIGGQDDADTLLREADFAMYLAKRAGRSRVEFFEN